MNFEMIALRHADSSDTIWVMSSRRYSLPSLRTGVKLPFTRKTHQRDGHSSTLGKATDMDAVEWEVQRVKRSMSSVHPGHCRPLPGQAQLHQIFGNRRVDRLTSKIDCDEVYPNILIGNE